MRIRTFKTKKSKKFFFSFLADNGDVILKSIPFESKEERDDAKRSTLKDFSKNKSAISYKDGFSYFIKSDYKGKTILNSEAFGSIESRDAAVKMLYSLSAKLLQEDIEAEDKIEKNTNAYKTDGKDDDYKPLDFYKKNKGKVSNGFSSFFDEVSSEHYFSYLSKDKVILLSEGYKTDKSRDNGIISVKKNISIPERYDRQQHQNGKYFFNLKAGNNQEIATSRWFDSEDEMNGTITNLLSGSSNLESSANKESAAPKETLGFADSSSKNLGEAKKEAPTKKEKKPKKDKGEKKIIKNGKYAVNDLVWQIFQSGGNKKFYYIIRDTKQKSVYFNANVKGYETAEEAEKNLIHSMNFSPSEDNFEVKVAKNGKYYFYVLDKEKKQVGKSFFYNNEADMKAAMSLLFHGSAGASAKTVSNKTTSQDEYLPCASYAGADGFHRFSTEGEEYFAFNLNGRTFLRSEGYSSVSGRDNGINSVIKNAQNDDRWKTDSDDEGHYYFLKAGNSQEIARSCPYPNEAEMQKALNWVRGEESILGKGAKEVDGTWVSAASLGLLASTTLSAKAEEEARLKAEAEAKAQAKAKAEEEARLKAEAEAKAQAKAKAEEEARLKAEAKAKAEEEARLKAEAKAVAKAEEEARLKAEAEAKAKAEEELALKLKKEKELEANKLAALAATPKAGLDEYLPCASYAGQKGFNSFEKEGLFYFSYVNDKGEVLLRSQAYKSAAGRDNGIESVKTNSKIKERWVETEEKGQHFYILKAGNKQEIARSCGTSNKESMNALFAAAAFTPWAAKKIITKTDTVKKEPIKKVEKEVTPIKKVEKVKKAKPVVARKKEPVVVQKTTERKAAAAAVAQDAGATGCLKKWWWLILLATLVPLIFLLLKNCNGDNIGTTADLTPPIKKEIVPPVIEKEEEKVVESKPKTEPEVKKDVKPVKQALCPNVSSKSLNLRSTTNAGKMADYLSNPASTYPKKFSMEYANFEFNEARMTQSGKDEIPRIAKVLKACKNCKVKIYGHIDQTEKDSYNGEYQDGSGISLSAIRARCAYKRLIDAGVPASKLEFVGLGKESQIAASDTESNRRKNRRVELEFIRK